STCRRSKSSRPRVEASPELFERLQVAMRVAEQTNGKFDPTVGPLVRAWGFLPQCAQGNSCREASRSSSKRLPEARAKVGWNKVHLDGATHTVTFDQPGME